LRERENWGRGEKDRGRGREERREGEREGGMDKSLIKFLKIYEVSYVLYVV